MDAKFLMKPTHTVMSLFLCERYGTLGSLPETYYDTMIGDFWNYYDDVRDDFTKPVLKFAVKKVKRDFLYSMCKDLNKWQQLYEDVSNSLSINQNTSEEYKKARQAIFSNMNLMLKASNKVIIFLDKVY
jgi:hypothetical protein